MGIKSASIALILLTAMSVSAASAAAVPRDDHPTNALSGLSASEQSELGLEGIGDRVISSMLIPETPEMFRKPSRWGESMGRKAKQAYTESGYQFTAGIFKGIRVLGGVRKLGKAAPKSQETAKVESALERLKSMKKEILPIANAARSFYKSSVETAREMQELSKKLQATVVNQETSHKIGTHMLFLANTKLRYLAALPEQILEPLDQFAQSDIPERSKMKLDYYLIKDSYDTAVFSLENLEKAKAKKKEQVDKAKGAAAAAKVELTESRRLLVSAVDALEQKRDTEILQRAQEFWRSFVDCNEEISEYLAGDTTATRQSGVVQVRLQDGLPTGTATATATVASRSQQSQSQRQPRSRSRSQRQPAPLRQK